MPTASARQLVRRTGRGGLTTRVVCCLLSFGSFGACFADGHDVARDYAADALAVVRDDAMFASRVDWAEANARTREISGESPAHAYPLIRWVLAELRDPHANLVAPGQMSGTGRPSSNGDIEIPTGRTLAGQIGYVKLPPIRAPAESQAALDYAAAAHGVFRSHAACGWVVDLRDNTGGVIAPMLAALAPLLGEGRAVGYASPGGRPVWHEIVEGRVEVGGDAILEFDPGTPRASGAVAVLINKRTASSAEGVLVALIGKGARTFGEATWGAPTAPMGFALSDRAEVQFSVASATDPGGRRYEGSIQPDERVLENRRNASEAWNRFMQQPSAWLPTCN